MSVTLETIAAKLQQKGADQLPLTEREREILEMVCKGQMSKQIAARLDISQKTVENIRRRLIDKLGAKSSAHLGWIAADRGLV